MMLIDCFILLLTGFTAFSISNSLSVVNKAVIPILPELLIFIALNILFLYIFKVYYTIWRYAGINEFFNLLAAITLGSASNYVILELTPLHINNLYSILAYVFSASAVIATRAIYCYIYALILKHEVKSRERTMIVGGGSACNELLREIFISSTCPYNPILIVDDDPHKQNCRISSIPIEGTTHDIPQLAERYRIKNILFAIPSCDAKNKKRIMSICAETNCTIKTMPYVHELLENGNLLEQVKSIKIDDLLGRDVITLKNSLLSETISGKICMVTGGGGSIGSELSRQIAANNPKQLIIVDIYENNAYDIEQELKRVYGKKLNLNIQIASVRDYDKMEKLFHDLKPQLVFHAAAHKHVPLMETNPEEAIKNNIFGTYNMASLAELYRAEKFVLVSTDKAVNPTNVMGATKRCCEMIVQYMAQLPSKTEFIAVRFGNVLGSNGSVIPLFEKQIADGKPITVTHPDIVRYFMTIPEAVSLILEAATIARGGEIFVLDMGEPVKILTLAENLIKLHGKEPYVDIQITFTGLRPGEKLYEELLMDEEGLRSTANDRIFVGKQIHVNPREFTEQLKTMKKYADANDIEKCVAMLKEVVPTFGPEQEKVAVS